MTDRPPFQGADFGEGWLDDDAGPVVPAFALTGGRTCTVHGDLDLVSLVVTVEARPGAGGVASHQAPVLGPEHEMILTLARSPLSIAELASDLDLALGVVRILLGDLLDNGLVQIRQPMRVAQFPTERVLKDVINGLRAL
ncbi:DUF742 domain-containing protein [Actinomadura sp. HBU206391]|uniref:DUF742 domain-containing protein n=1 Tax=Actinomadura sp. HBU206391 TaxID=2731692 RepID=UPI00164F60CB|nr:DUF742 domain-containing protein [Actinomadura sp. HBU206391]MBC6458324.1 DUF742 domain-containing protein [Actinomadura sp. HBU206391]